MAEDQAYYKSKYTGSQIDALLDKVNDGDVGGAGKSPYIGANGNWYEWNEDLNDYADTGTPATGPQGPAGADGATGPQGPQGEDGRTPVRGTDYWTAADIAEIKSYVDDAILGGAW